ncbi:unnamed protein product [Pleuronectes platessa]|uniref:Uncharacterized protein n=1 Tax=Pleuronectes platessa TaxID=8262 RepID=A0A9N7VKP0_PLEPL|nr:unnamed protein product [Pleuronectes platessa]
MAVERQPLSASVSSMAADKEKETPPRRGRGSGRLQVLLPGDQILDQNLDQNLASVQRWMCRNQKMKKDSVTETSFNCRASVCRFGPDEVVHVLMRTRHFVVRAEPSRAEPQSGIIDFREMVREVEAAQPESKESGRRVDDSFL